MNSIVEAQEWDPDFGRSVQADTNVAKLFEGPVVSEHNVE